MEPRGVTLYDSIGSGYATFRRPDPRIAAAIDAALADAASVVNVGAGSGSYEPPGRTLLAVEPSEVMIRQRPLGAAPCVRAAAEALPLRTGCIDGVMAVLTIHHWADLKRGLGELARVARRRVVLLTWTPDAARFWLTEDYFPEIAAHDRGIFPTAAGLAGLLESLMGPVRITPLPIPHDCTDGLLAAHWRRPARYLEDDVRSAMSSFARIDAAPGLARLRADLADGRWMERHGRLLALNELDLGYRLICCERRSCASGRSRR